MASNGTSDDLESQYDILPKMIPFLDRHLIYPIIADLDDSPDVTKFKFELLKETNMIDFLISLDKEIRGSEDTPKEYQVKREEQAAKLNQHEQDSAKIRALLDDPDVTSNLRSDKIANLNYLKEQHGVTDEMVNSLYDFGQFMYSRGSYPEAAELLSFFRILSTDNDKVNSATWGKLASEILGTEWESAMEEITKVKESIDSRLYQNSYAQLQSRTWLIHWSLFPYFNHEPARDTITDLFFSQTFINTIQTSCPWILRYLTAAVITNRSRSRHSNTYQKQLKDLIRIVRQEAYEYSDPLTDFVRALYLDFDFEGAQKKLSEAEQLLRNDFFLISSADAFVDSARHLISESYCKIHQRIDIKDLSTRLGLSETEGEKWIVNLIRDTRVDAKIDYQAGTVEMNHPPQSVYQQVIERTKGGFFRTQVLSSAVAK